MASRPFAGHKFAMNMGAPECRFDSRMQVRQFFPSAIAMGGPQAPPSLVNGNSITLIQSGQSVGPLEKDDLSVGRRFPRTKITHEAR